MIHVCAAIIGIKGKYLITSRPAGTHLEGRWEFPGGKLSLGETAGDCLVREIREELGLLIIPLDKIYSVIHHYTEKSVSLDFYRALPVDINKLSITAHDNQCIAWASPEELKSYDFVEADVPVVKYLSSRQWSVGSGQ